MLFILRGKSTDTQPVGRTMSFLATCNFLEGERNHNKSINKLVRNILLDFGSSAICAKAVFGLILPSFSRS